MIPTQVQKYLEGKALRSPWKLEGQKEGNFQGAIVIPSLAERAYLFDTLQSIARNPQECLSRFLVIIVVNQRLDATPEDREDNQWTLRRLRTPENLPRIPNLAWVDASSPGLELPLKCGGVGMARKIGMDLALSFLDYETERPVLISLDADTLVEPTYLPALIRHFQKSKTPGAVLPFCHSRGQSPEAHEAICRYELFLRAYVLGLARAGSPYAFHTIGSAMACTAEGYVRMGGMNCRMAAEDFYFLQHLARIGGVEQVEGTTVYPSPRPSHRVPFGTGRSVSRFLAKEKKAILFYRRECFQILKDWLRLISQNLSEGGAQIRHRAQAISDSLGLYLDAIRFPEVWEKLRKNFHRPSMLHEAFHHWFDGLKTMKLIHHLSSGPYPRGEPEEILPAFFHWAGLESGPRLEERLALLRSLQQAQRTERISESGRISEWPLEIPPNGR